MKYQGTIYGKVAGKYVPLSGSSADVDQLEKNLETTRRQLEIALEALSSISLAERDTTSSYHEKMTSMAMDARQALDEINKVGGA